MSRVVRLARPYARVATGQRVTRTDLHELRRVRLRSGAAVCRFRFSSAPDGGSCAARFGSAATAGAVSSAEPFGSGAAAAEWAAKRRSAKPSPRALRLFRRRRRRLSAPRPAACAGSRGRRRALSPVVPHLADARFGGALVTAGGLGRRRTGLRVSGEPPEDGSPSREPAGLHVAHQGLARRAPGARQASDPQAPVPVSPRRRDHRADSASEARAESGTSATAAVSSPGSFGGVSMRGGASVPGARGSGCHPRPLVPDACRVRPQGALRPEGQRATEREESDPGCGGTDPSEGGTSSMRFRRGAWWEHGGSRRGARAHLRPRTSGRFRGGRWRSRGHLAGRSAALEADRTLGSALPTGATVAAVTSGLFALGLLAAGPSATGLLAAGLTAAGLPPTTCMAAGEAGDELAGAPKSTSRPRRSPTTSSMTAAMDGTATERVAHQERVVDTMLTSHGIPWAKLQMGSSVSGANRCGRPPETASRAPMYSASSSPSERLETAADRDALLELTQPGSASRVASLGLTREHDLENLLL